MTVSVWWLGLQTGWDSAVTIIIASFCVIMYRRGGKPKR
jgi:hypothetical protein